MIRFFLILSVLFTTSAVAGGHPPPPPNGGNVNGEQHQSANADADASSKSNADADSASKSKSNSNSSGVGVGEGGSAASLSGSGANSGGNSTEFSNHSLGLTLPGFAGATGVEACHESRGSLGAFGVGSGGRTRINSTCADREHCLALADRLASWGQVPMAVAQLQTCGGVEGSVVTKAPEAAVTKEELRRAFEAAQKK
jgi:hypothetical protein